MTTEVERAATKTRIKKSAMRHTLIAAYRVLTLMGLPYNERDEDWPERLDRVHHQLAMLLQEEFDWHGDPE